jgi:very-short-patch-repair endonuclease
MEDPAVLAAMQHQGVATWAQLRTRATRRQVEAAVRDGRLVRVARGRYALPRSPDPLRAAVALGGVASHTSAARLWFLETLLEPDAVDVSVPRWRRARPRRGVRAHWCELDPAEVRGRVTSPVRTVLDCARSLPFREGLAVADSALRRRLVEPEDLTAAAAALRVNGARQARRVVALADGRAANPFESGLRAEVLELGIEGFVPQQAFRTPRLQGYVDLGDPLRRIALEADSFAHHGSRSALDRDCRRYDELVRTGWVVLRFSWEQVMFDRSWVAETISETVAEHDRKQVGRRGPHASPAGPTCLRSCSRKPA